MLRVSKAEEQALRLLMRMAKLAGQVTLGELAASERLPEPTVAKLLGRLRDGGLVRAVRGRHGGYELAAGPAKVSVAAVLRALGAAGVAPHTCDSRGHAVDPCPRLQDCGLRSVWAHVESRVTDLLERITLADLLGAEPDMDARLAAMWPAAGGADIPIMHTTRSWDR